VSWGQDSVAHTCLEPSDALKYPGLWLSLQKGTRLPPIGPLLYLPAQRALHLWSVSIPALPPESIIYSLLKSETRNEMPSGATGTVLALIF